MGAREGGRGGKEDAGGEKIPVLYFKLFLRNEDNYQLNYVLYSPRTFLPFHSSAPPPPPTGATRRGLFRFNKPVRRVWRRNEREIFLKTH